MVIYSEFIHTEIQLFVAVIDNAELEEHGPCCQASECERSPVWEDD